MQASAAYANMAGARKIAAGHLFATEPRAGMRPSRSARFSSADSRSGSGTRTGVSAGAAAGGVTRPWLRYHALATIRNSRSPSPISSPLSMPPGAVARTAAETGAGVATAGCTVGSGEASAAGAATPIENGVSLETP